MMATVDHRPDLVDRGVDGARANSSSAEATCAAATPRVSPSARATAADCAINGRAAAKSWTKYSATAIDLRQFAKCLL